MNGEAEKEASKGGEIASGLMTCGANGVSSPLSMQREMGSGWCADAGMACNAKRGRGIGCIFARPRRIVPDMLISCGFMEAEVEEADDEEEE